MSAVACNSGEAVAPEPPPVPGVLFVISAPPGTPAGDSLFVSGNVPELGSWDGRGLRLEKTSAGDYRAGAPLDAGTPIEFKITRGSWTTVEKAASGAEIPNRTHTVTGVDTVRVAVEAWRDAAGERPHTLSGEIRYHHDVASWFLARPRDVIVYLPPGYGTGGDRYPVLYMQDGQNLMDAATSFLGIEWGMDEALEAGIPPGEIQPLILVGVYNTADRIAEYTPVADPAHGGGEADLYGRFLVEELKPMIDATYRTDPAPEATGLAGSSLGGLVSLYLGLTHPGTFTRLGVVSPSVWWANREILQEVAGRARTPARIWLDIGTAEGSTAAESRSLVEAARDLRDALTAKGWLPGVDLDYFEAPGAHHDETAWAARAGNMLRFLYPGGKQQRGPGAPHAPGGDR